MANTVICAELKEGIDFSCSKPPAKKYFQEAVLINMNDIDKATSTIGNLGGATCDYFVQMLLKKGKKGVKIKLPETGNAIKGSFDKSKNDNGFVQYLHKVQILMLGASAETKCKLDKLDRGRYVAALQLTDGTVEIYGWDNGLTTADYSYDVTEGGGGSLIVLQSDEKGQEDTLPLVYKPKTGGDANADFNEQFEAP